MAKTANTLSELVQAASDLDAELQRFEEGVGDFTKLSLSSKKNLDRAGKMLEDLAQSEAAMGGQIQALVQAVAATRDRQLARVNEIRQKAEQLKDRSIEFRDLIVQFESLGTGAAELNAKLQQPAPAVVDVANDVSALAARAEQLVGLSKEKGFDDVAHMADGLRQQLQSLQKKFATKAPAS
ncbi:MAG: hypothetical protein JNK82_15895 [Myxococcaceae bacterium]|nr:hypothetical protein [Myxococcaceae bacterium]